jgi:hypothetical protein
MSRQISLRLPDIFSSPVGCAGDTLGSVGELDCSRWAHFHTLRITPTNITEQHLFIWCHNDSGEGTSGYTECAIITPLSIYEYPPCLRISIKSLSLAYPNTGGFLTIKADMRDHETVHNHSLNNYPRLFRVHFSFLAQRTGQLAKPTTGAKICPHKKRLLFHEFTPLQTHPHTK